LVAAAVGAHDSGGVEAGENFIFVGVHVLWCDRIAQLFL
jgi:hypothetical protein